MLRWLLLRLLDDPLVKRKVVAIVAEARRRNTDGRGSDVSAVARLERAVAGINRSFADRAGR